MAVIYGTSGNDTIRGTTGDDTIYAGLGNDRVIGDRGDDLIYGGGGSDTLDGWGGNDTIISHGNGGRLGGQEGDDYLEAQKTGFGQFHIYGGTGNDTISMALNNQQTWGPQGHHAYGGQGNDRFVFTNTTSTPAGFPLLGRIDDFDPSRDSIWMNSTQLNLNSLPSGVRIVSYLGQQWLVFNNAAMYALEGARQGGTERHFPDVPASISALVTVAFVNPFNYVPHQFYSGFESTLTQVNVAGTLVIIGSNMYRTITGTDGDDMIYDDIVNQFQGSADGMHGGGTQTQSANALIYGGLGRDVVQAGKGNDTVYGGDGDDLISGGLDNDLLYGDAGNDRMYGGSENDTLYGGTGNDTLFGATGNDLVYGDSGNDQIYGGDGADTLHGGTGTDTMYGDAGADLMYGGNHNDRMFGGDSNDSVYGGAGNDIVYGGNGHDRVFGGSGNDTVYGDSGNDRVRGDAGNDILYGGSGNDLVFGGTGNDTIFGGSGNDLIQGGAGRDVAYGGAGADVFVFASGDLLNWGQLVGTHDERNAQIDVIADFEIGVDTIRLTGWSGVTSLANLQAWQTFVDGNMHYAVQVRGTELRFLVDVADNVTWAQFMTSTHFEFA